MAEETKKTVDSEEEIKTSEEEKTTREETAEETEKQAEHAEGTETEEENVSEKKGFFGKKKKDKKDTQIEDLTDKLRRQMAEFDNFRKRTEKEKSGMFEMGAKSVVEKLLPVVDNFERGLASEIGRASCRERV